METVLLVRVSGEVGTKSRSTRLRMERHLMKNIRRVLSEGYTITHTLGRIFIRGPGVAYFADDIKRFFGIASVSVCTQVVNSLEAINDAAVYCAGMISPEHTFRVSVRRVKSYPYESPELERMFAEKVHASYPYLHADLKHPHITLAIEVREDFAFVSTEIRKGPEGLPYGAEGKALVLFSGGFDSAVAAWEIARRGIALEFVLFQLGGEAQVSDAAFVYNTLISLWHMHDAQLHIVDGSTVITELQEKIDDNYKQLVFKALLYQCCCSLARERHISALVTGECLGQVSTQTLQNLQVLDSLSLLLVLRPLLGRSKEEIITLSKSIGTYTSSVFVKEFCQLTDTKVVTKGTHGALAKQLLRLLCDVTQLPTRTIIGLSDISREDFIPLRLDNLEILFVSTLSVSVLQQLDKTRQYLFVCSRNITARNFASFFRKRGYTCYALDMKRYEEMKSNT